MGRSKSIVRQITEIYLSLAAFGDSKHMDKLSNGGQPAKDKIYSSVTMDNYIDAGVRFVKWAKAEHGCRTVAEARAYTGDYLRYRMEKGCSPWTIRRDAAAIAKAYGCKTSQLGAELPKRRRSAVTQHRNGSWKGHFDAERHKDLMALGRSCGLRRHEMAALKPEDVRCMPDGRVLVHVAQGKGGKERFVVALDDIPLHLAEKAKAEGRSTVIAHIPKYAPIHELRAEFAQSLYKKLARPVETLPRREQYVCRKDLSGAVFDKRAMSAVSTALGHNRLDVVTAYLLH